MKDSIKTKLIVYVPLFTPADSNEKRKEFWKLLDELPDLSGKIGLAYLYEGEWSDVKLSIFDGDAKTRVVNRDDTKFHRIWSVSNKARARYVLKITVSITFSRSFALSELKDWKASKVDKVRAYREQFYRLIQDAIYDLTLSLNLARPGLFEIGGIFIFQDGKLAHTTNATINALGMSIEAVEKIGWPKLQSLELLEVWNWAISNRLFGSVGQTPLARAFNAFSYLFFEPAADDVVSLFWALIGIEALYVSDAIKVMEQVRERSQMFLGQLTAYKKKLSRMYDIRSKFIHGALPFPGKFFTSDALPEYEHFIGEVSDASLMAQAILTATLQEMAKRGWRELRFTTVLTAPAD